MSLRPQNIVVTGAAGSGGSYMTEYLVQHYPNEKIFALVRNPHSAHGGHLTPGLPIEVVACDLQDFDAVKKTLGRIQPDRIFHFASNANVLQSFEKPAEVLTNNIQSTVNLFEACRQLQISPKILMCSTSEVYGQVFPHEVPIKETNALRPASPYAVSKTTQDLLSEVYYRAYKIPIVRTRMFTYINPRRENLFATSFAMQVARIEAGLQSKLKHGNLDSVRTHLDIRDVLKAYDLAMELGVPGEIYNIGGTESFTVRELLELLVKKSSVKIECELDQSLMRPVDVTLQIPDVSKFEALTKWRPAYGLEESINLLLSECRKKVKDSVAAQS